MNKTCSIDPGSETRPVEIVLFGVPYRGTLPPTWECCCGFTSQDRAEMDAHRQDCPYTVEGFLKRRNAKKD